MVDGFTIWGITVAGGFVGSIMKDLGKNLAKDWSKDFFKWLPGAVYKKFKKKERDKAAVAAIREFLVLVEDELEFTGLHEAEVDVYEDSLKRFLMDGAVRELLGGPFQEGVRSVDTERLGDYWQDMDLEALPDEFNWADIGKSYFKKAKVIIRKSTELRDILDSENLERAVVAGERTAAATERIAGVSPGFDTKQYADAIIKRYGNINMDSLDTSGYAYNELKLWRMFIPQSVRECREFVPQAYEVPKEFQKKLRESGELDEELTGEQLERYRKVYIDQPAFSVIDLFERAAKQHMVILGDPGSGKSSFLQYIALDWARVNRSTTTFLPFPLLVELRAYVRDCENGKCKDFLTFFHSGNTFCRFDQNKLDGVLTGGRAFVLFDGLDEVFDPSQREEIVTAIILFASQYPFATIMVTSRVIGYKTHPFQNAGFAHYLLQDLDEGQVDNFINRWHELNYDEVEERKRKRERLKKSLEASKAIQELSGNPLLLTMMAILNRHQELPRDRVELYNQASRVLLHQWDIERTIIDKDVDPITIDYRDKQAILRNVAFHMQCNDKGLAGNIIHQDNLEKIIADYLDSINIDNSRKLSRLLIDRLRERNFILCFLGVEYYAFVHRTFLEFFCAWEIVERFGQRDSGSKSGLTKEMLMQNFYGKHWQDESWHETLRLISGMIDSKFVGEIIEYLAEINGENQKFMNLFLAADCLAEVRNRSTISRESVKLFHLIKVLSSWDLHYFYLSWEPKERSTVEEIRTRSISVIASSWRDNPDAFEWLKTCANESKDGDVRRTAVQELSRGWKNNPNTLGILKICAQKDEDGDVRGTALRELSGGWRDNSSIFSILKERVKYDEDGDVRNAALSELLLGWRDKTETLTLLKSCALEDEYGELRKTAVRELARGWKNDPDTLTILKTHAQKDKYGPGRLAAVRELVRGWKDDPEILAILRALSQEDEHGYVRHEVVQELARGWKNAPDSLKWLKTQVNKSVDGYIRHAAVQELARGWKNDPEILTILKTLSVDDEDMDVRLVSAKELARGWKGDPDTLKILRKQALEDESGYVRQAVILEIVRGWKDDPDTATLLKQRAQKDDHVDVQYTAILSLARNWKNDPDTLMILKTCAQEDESKTVINIAVRELVRGWKNDPNTLEWLKTNSEKSKNSIFRTAAIRELSNCLRRDPEIVTILKTRAMKDHSSNVRIASIQELARYWKDDPEVLVIQKACAQKDKDGSVRSAAITELARRWKEDQDILTIFIKSALKDKDNEVRCAAAQELSRGWKNSPDTLMILKNRVLVDDDQKVRLAAFEELARNWKDDSDVQAFLAELKEKEPKLFR